MKNVLFVDDEPMVLDSLRNLLRKHRQKWDMSFAIGATAALEEMTRRPFDVVISDMRMPGMDGATLLGKIKALYPGTARIILSGYGEREMIMRALPVSHQYLSKPCDAETLRMVIDRACQLHALLVDPRMREMVGKLDRIPSMPETYWDLTNAVSDPDVSMNDIAKIIERDPSLSLKVLQLANSAYFGLSQTVASIPRAVGYLGMEVIKNLVLTTELFSAATNLAPIPGFSIREIFDRSLAVASVAKEIMPDRKRAGEAYTAGILHDIGKIILAMGEPRRFAEVIDVALQSKRPLFVVEKEILGVSHAEVGAFLLGSWGLPIETVAAVAFHHSLSEATDVGELTVAVHVADALVETILPPDDGSICTNGIDIAVIDSMGLSSKLQEWEAIAKRTLAHRNAGESSNDSRKVI